MSPSSGSQQGLKGNQQRFVVLDRDSTIIVDRHYVFDPAQLELLPGAAAGLRQMQNLGLGLIAITNQSGIDRSLWDRGQLNRVHQRFRELLVVEGVHLDGIYVCPHKPDDACHCRKPETGLLESAALDLRFDPKDCFVIGDKSSDIELGQRVGAITLLVQTGYSDQTALSMMTSPNHIADNLWEIVQIIRYFIIY